MRRGWFAVVWGLTGVGLLLVSAVYRLGLRASGLSGAVLHWHHWAVLLLLIPLMAYSEGYRGFQQGFSPRVAARARYLFKSATLTEAVFAPFFLMCYFGAPRRRQLISVALTVGIVGLILLARMLPQPWREILDLAVVVGLAWGVVSLAVFTIRAFTHPEFHYSAELKNPA